MIYDGVTNSVVGNLGWVDGGSLWFFSIKDGRESQVVIDDAKYVGLKPGRNGLLRVVHHESSLPSVSIRHISDPARELSKIFLIGERWHFAGDINLWKFVDPSVIIRNREGPKLLWIDRNIEQVIHFDLTWYNNSDYNAIYIRLVDSIFLPETGHVVVSVQRSSKLVVIDPHLNQLVGAITLAGRQGNPALGSRSSHQFVATAYDCLCLVDARTGLVRCSEPLQVARAPMARQFIGDYDLGETTCAVARPFGGDVVLLDLDTLAVRERAPVAGQPLAVCMTSASTFVTRDWKSGKVEVGKFG